MHPAWPRCESLKYLDIPALSRLASRAPHLLKTQISFCANPSRVHFLPIVAKMA